MRFQAQRGTEDVLPEASYRWQHVEREFFALARQFGYQEIRTPMFEDTELFLRTAGDTSDIVTKEMYSFKDKGDREITLKPEGTAPIMRALIEHSLCPPGAIARLCYATPIFRYARPGKGRLRQAHQLGIELAGAASVAADAEVIELTVKFFERVGLIDRVVRLNSIGRDECRAAYGEAILNHISTFLSGQSEEMQARARKNPLGVLDTKDPGLRDALAGVPSILDYLEDDCRRRFDELQRLLTLAEVPFLVSPEIVRGLDYYTETVFEIVPEILGGQSSVCGGGRYDGLVESLGGAKTPSVGMALGIERTLLCLELQETAIPTGVLDAFVVSATPAAMDTVLEVSRLLRASGLATAHDLESRSLKSQLRQADKSGARLAILIGEEEMEKGVASVRDLAHAEQQEIARDSLVAHVLGLVRP